MIFGILLGEKDAIGESKLRGPVGSISRVSAAQRSTFTEFTRINDLLFSHESICPKREIRQIGVWTSIEPY